MRTRILSRLSNFEVEDYLKRNDIIFIPVGPTEMHGRCPLEIEYIGPLGMAMAMAEKVDGLVLDGLKYFYIMLKIDQFIKAIWCLFRLKSGKWIKKIEGSRA